LYDGAVLIGQNFFHHRHVSVIGQQIKIRQGTEEIGFAEIILHSRILSQDFCGKTFVNLVEQEIVNAHAAIVTLQHLARRHFPMLVAVKPGVSVSLHKDVGVGI